MAISQKKLALTTRPSCPLLTQTRAATFNGITNNTTLTQTGAATFNGITNNTTLSQTGAATFNGITNNTTLTQTGVATFNGITNNGSFTQTAPYIITNSTQSTNTITGALQIGGGVGIQKYIFVGGKVIVVVASVFPSSPI